MPGTALDAGDGRRYQGRLPGIAGWRAVAIFVRTCWRAVAIFVRTCWRQVLGFP